MEKRSITYCPNCGQQLVISAQSDAPRSRSLIQSGWQQTRQLESSQQLHNISTATPEMPTGDWQKVTPVGRLTAQDVTTSIYDAGVSGGLVTITVFGICWYFDWPPIISPVVGAGVLLLRYFGGISLAKSLLEIVETVTQRDIDQDGQIGNEPPLAPSQTVRVEIKETGEAKRWRFEEFAIEPAKLYSLASRVISGESFSERTATEVNLTQEEFRQLRNKFLAANLARWNHPTRKQQGVSLTRGGRAILRAVLDTPLPDANFTQNPLPGSTQQHAAGNYVHINTERR